MEVKTFKKVILTKNERLQLDIIFRLANNIKLPDNILFGRTFTQENLHKRLLKAQFNSDALSREIKSFL